MIKKMRVLQDLWISFVGGYAGIPQDARHIFNVLSSLDSIQVDGLIYSKNKTMSFNSQVLAKSQQDTGKQVHHVFNDLLKTTQLKTSKIGLLSKVKLLASLFITNSVFKNKYQLFSIDDSRNDLLWKHVFEKSLNAEERNHVLSNDFCASDLSWQDIMYAGLYQKKVQLNTEGYDYVIFPDVRAVTVSPATKKIVRYHDSFAFLCPDFFQTYHSMMHLNSLKACVSDSYFVCDSAPTRDDLLKVYPEIEKNAFIIPPVVMPCRRVNNWDVVKNVCVTRASHLLLNRACDASDHEFEYILALSTLEPRKNYINLIRAWENLYNQYDQKIKLIIVANPGWLSDEIEAVMKPHVEMGNIIHLNNVPSDEMAYLFSHATLFASVSFTEGFGIPPIEAMQCGCPVLASGNATYRWTMGDAAFYVDPYDVVSITHGMAELLCREDSVSLRQSLADKGLKRANLYTKESVQSQWLGLFDDLSSVCCS